MTYTNCVTATLKDVTLRGQVSVDVALTGGLGCIVDILTHDR